MGTKTQLTTQRQRGFKHGLNFVMKNERTIRLQ